MYSLLRFVPKNLLSLLIGKVVNLPLPPPLSTLSVNWFKRFFKIDLSEATESKYRSIGELFVRELKAGSRPVGAEPVSPVDGTLRNFGPIQNGELPQIKGKNYSVERFLGDRELAQRFAQGYYFNFYLSPPDYHHVHAPVGAEVTKYIHIPGKLWPVNDWSISNIDELFVVNERVVILLKSAFGMVAVVMVGATNVGSISLNFDKEFRSNRFRLTRGNPQSSSVQGVQVKAGDRLGTFHMGSSVVVLFEKEPQLNELIVPLKIKFGTSLCKR